MFLIGVQKLATVLPELCQVSQPPQWDVTPGCYTGTIFNVTSLQIVPLKIIQCDITFIKEINHANAHRQYFTTTPVVKSIFLCVIAVQVYQKN